MKFTSEIGKEIVVKLADMYSFLPEGNVWMKYQKNRIYYNQKEEEIDYAFYISFDEDKPNIVDFVEDYWGPKIAPETKESLELAIEKIYYPIAYPLNQPFPANTIREIRIHRRFECIIQSDRNQEYELILLPQELEVKMPKTAVDEKMKTDRDYKGNDVMRITIKYDALDEVTDHFEEKEDEADMLYMQNLQKSVPSKIKVAMDKTRKKSGDIEIESGETRICVNCQKEFISYDDIGAQFCSNNCKKDFQQDSW